MLQKNVPIQLKQRGFPEPVTPIERKRQRKYTVDEYPDCLIACTKALFNTYSAQRCRHSNSLMQRLG